MQTTLHRTYFHSSVACVPLVGWVFLKSAVPRGFSFLLSQQILHPSNVLFGLASQKQAPSILIIQCMVTGHRRGALQSLPQDTRQQLNVFTKWNKRQGLPVRVTRNRIQYFFTAVWITCSNVKDLWLNLEFGDFYATITWDFSPLLSTSASLLMPGFRVMLKELHMASGVDEVSGAL